MLEQTPPPQQISTAIGIGELPNNLNIISIYSKCFTKQPLIFEYSFEHCILLIIKRFELLMFTQVVTPGENFSSSAVAETKATFNILVF